MAPLWFTEGLAEHWSRAWDADGDLIAARSGALGQLPPIEEFWRYEGTFTIYKLGQSVLDFMAETYGDDKLLLFYRRLGRSRASRIYSPLILGVDENGLSARWTQWLRRRYYPDGRADALGDGRLGRTAPIWGVELKPTPVPPGVRGMGERVRVSLSRNRDTEPLSRGVVREVGKPDRACWSRASAARRCSRSTPSRAAWTSRATGCSSSRRRAATATS